MSDTHTAKKPNETTSEETAAAVSRFQSGVEVAEPEQEARVRTAGYARFFLERAEPPACFNRANEEERRFRFIPFETKFTDDAARGPR